LTFAQRMSVYPNLTSELVGRLVDWSVGRLIGCCFLSYVLWKSLQTEVMFLENFILLCKTNATNQLLKILAANRKDIIQNHDAVAVFIAYVSATYCGCTWVVIKVDTFVGQRAGAWYGEPQQKPRDKLHQWVYAHAKPSPRNKTESSNSVIHSGQTHPYIQKYVCRWSWCALTVAVGRYTGDEKSLRAYSASISYMKKKKMYGETMQQNICHNKVGLCCYLYCSPICCMLLSAVSLYV